MRRSAGRILHVLAWPLVLLGLAVSLALAAPARSAPPRPAAPAAPHDLGAPHDLAQPRDLAPPSHLPRALSDACNYNRLQRTVLEQQRDGILRELARLEAEQKALLEQLRTYQLDPSAGDGWDERTLEIRRRPRP